MKEPVPGSDQTSLEPEQKEYPVKSVPTIVQYQKLYANSCGNNDKKAAKLFKEFEGREKHQRLIRELLAILHQKVADETVEAAVGKTRKAKYGSNANWARMLISALNTKSL